MWMILLALLLYSGGTGDRTVRMNDAAVIGRSPAGSSYELRLSKERRRLRRGAPALRLRVMRPGHGAFDDGDRLTGPVLADGGLLVATMIFCQAPQESLFYGQLPSRAAGLKLALPDGREVTAVTAPSRGGAGQLLFLVAAPGAVGRSTAVILDHSGHEVERKDLTLGGDPCAPSQAAASGGAATAVFP